MFGSLKKKLKAALSKVSGAIAKEEPEQPAEELYQEKKETISSIIPPTKAGGLSDDVVPSSSHPLLKGNGFRSEDRIIREEAKETEKQETAVEIAEPKFPEKTQPDQRIDNDAEQQEEAEKTEEKLREEIGEKIEKLKYIEENISAGKESHIEEVMEEKDILQEVKKERSGLLAGLAKKITEKALSDSDIQKILRELQIALLENDVAFEAADKICHGVRLSLVNKPVKRGGVESAIRRALREAMLDILRQEPVSLEAEIEKKPGPCLILFCGFNGTGKSTTIAKLAKRLKKYRPVMAAGDTFRAASIEQLEEHGKRLDVRVIKHKYGSDSAAVIFDAVKHAQASGSRVVLADTAGRSHSNANLMDELKKVVRVNKPDMKILVLDSLTGNDIYDQSRLFDEAIGIDAIILTKTDVYEKGGAAISATFTIKKPVLFLGTGQGYDDLKELDAEEIVSGLLD